MTDKPQTTPIDREKEISELMEQTGSSHETALNYWLKTRAGLSDADRERHREDASCVKA